MFFLNLIQNIIIQCRLFLSRFLNLILFRVCLVIILHYAVENFYCEKQYRCFFPWNWQIGKHFIFEICSYIKYLKWMYLLQNLMDKCDKPFLKRKKTEKRDKIYFSLNHIINYCYCPSGMNNEGVITSFIYS